MWGIIQYLIMLISVYFIAIAVACFMAIRQRYFGSDEKENHENNKVIAASMLADVFRNFSDEIAGFEVR
jgi:hypothetical protein